MIDGRVLRHYTSRTTMKTHRGWTVSAVLLFACFAALSAVGAEPPPTALFVRCGSLIADTSKPAISPAQVVITDGRVTAVGAHLSAPAGAKEIDLSRYTCLPGLIDAHVHYGMSAARFSAPLVALDQQHNVKHTLDSGVVAVRVLDSAEFVDVALAKAVEDGTIPGPHIVPGGHAITVLGGHGDQFNFSPSRSLDEYYTPLHGFISSPADAEQAVRLQIKYGARVIKILASGGVHSPQDSPEDEQISAEEMRVIVEQAHMRGLKVAAHLQNIRATMDALHAGLDSVEHGAQLDRAAIDWMKQHGTVLVPTIRILVEDLESADKKDRPAEWGRKARQLAEKQFASYKMAVAAGVTMATGSDSTYCLSCRTVLDEMVEMVTRGSTPQQVLTAATTNGAALLGLPDLGTVEEGKEGDLVAIEGDPLKDISAVKQVRAVIFKGQVVERTPVAVLTNP